MATIETAYYVPTFLGLSTTFAISCSISIACIAAFEICKRLNSMQYLFSPRTQLLENASRKQSPHLFSWISSTLHLRESEYVTKVGLDATMHLRFLRMVVQFLFIHCIIICPILLALHWTRASVSLNSTDLLNESTTLDKNERNSPVKDSTAYYHFKTDDTVNNNSNDTIPSTEDEDKLSADTVSLPDLYGIGFPIFQGFDSSSNNSNSLVAIPIDHFRSNSTFYHFSIANIPNRNPIVWVHVLFAFTISLSWLWLLFVNHLHHVKLLQVQKQQQQQEHTTLTETSQNKRNTAVLLHQRSVLVTHIPHSLRNEDSLKKYFYDHLGVDQNVEQVTLVPDRVIKCLRPFLKKREKTIDLIEKNLIHMARVTTRYQRKLGEASTSILTSSSVSMDWYKCLQYSVQHQLQLNLEDRVVTVSRLLAYLGTLDDEISKLRDSELSSELYTPTATAFITFKTPHSAQACAQMVTSWKPGVLSTRMAPEPRDLLWRTLLRRGRKSRIAGIIRHWIVFVAVWSLTIFWLFPITFILGLTSIQSLSNHVAFLRYFLASSLVIRTFVQNILPTLLVTLCMSFLPWIVLELSKKQDFLCYSELEDSVLGRYYHFAIFNVLIVFLLGTTFLTTMLDVLYEPTMLIQLLANALPQGANFFLNYILFNCCTHAMELIQLGSQLFGHLFFTQPFLSRTPRLRLKYTQPWSFLYYYYYPHHILVFVITLTYSVIQPLILIFSLFYFSFALVVYRHQYMYCYIRRYESNGTRHYRRMARYTSDGLLIFQLTMVGLLYLKGVIAAATAILPLVVFTIWAKMKLHGLFKYRMDHPPAVIEKNQYAESNTISSPFPQSEQQKQSHVTNNRRKFKGTILAIISMWTLWCQHFNDIWKFSYVRDWWKMGRYATELQQKGSHKTRSDVLERPTHTMSSKIGNGVFVISHNILQAISSTERSDVTTLTPVCVDNSDEDNARQNRKQYYESSRSSSVDNCCSTIDNTLNIDLLADRSNVDYSLSDNEGFDIRERERDGFLDHGSQPESNNTNNGDSNEKEPSNQRYQDYTVYKNDYKSEYETYTHPALMMPLTTDFILPLNVDIWYWNLKECVSVSFELIRSIFVTPNDQHTIQESLQQIVAEKKLETVV